MIAPVLAAAFFFAAPLPVDSWAPFEPHVVASAGGEYGVAWSGSMRSSTFTYFARGVDAAPIAAERGDARTRPSDADRVIARGEFDQLPYQSLVSATGLGFATVERYGGLGYGHSLTTFDAAGRVVTDRRLEQLFEAEERDALLHTVSSVWWVEGAWIDEAAAELVVFGGGKVFAASFRADSVRTGDDETFVRGLTCGGEAGARLCLERLAPLGRADLRETYVALYGESHELATRLRAGHALGVLGDRRAAPLFQALAFPAADAAPAKEVREYALAHLARVLGESALPRLREALRGEATESWWPTLQGLVAYGEAAVPTLCEMVGEVGESADYRGGAAHALRDVGSKRALPALLAAVGDADGYVANAALNAAIAIDAAGIAGRLVEWLDAGTTQVGRLAGYFQERRHPAAAAALERALGRSSDDFERRQLAAALAFQRGE